MLAFPNLSVAAIVFAGRELTGPGGRLRERAMWERTRELLARLHLDVSPDARMESLPTAQRQLVQVARALVFECRILALDEPTTSLTDAETDHLFAILEDLRHRGLTLLYVSHRLPEVFRLCDRITVLRDGGHVGTFPRAEVATADVVRAMVGRDLPPRKAEARPPASAPLLALRNWTRRPCFQGISLSLRAGEVVGLFGLVGSGRSELLETLVGLDAADEGVLELGGRAVRFGSPRRAARAGLVLVPEERQRQGLLFNLGLADNLALPRAVADGDVVLRRDRERRAGEGPPPPWRITAPPPHAPPHTPRGADRHHPAGGDRVLHLVPVAGGRPQSPVPQRRQWPPDPEVLVRLWHRRRRRRHGDHLRRRGPLPRRRDRPGRRGRGQALRRERLRARDQPGCRHRGRRAGGGGHPGPRPYRGAAAGHRPAGGGGGGPPGPPPSSRKAGLS